MTDFSEWIQAELKRRNWSQATLAERASLSLSSIRRVLVTGSRQPGMKFLAGIATAFEMPLAEVIVVWKQAGERENQAEKG